MMQLVAQHVAHQSVDCEFLLDEYRDASGRQMLLAHLNVLAWSKEALKRVKREWSLFRQHVTEPLYALPMLSPIDDGFSKWRRFVTMFGWRATDQWVLCRDGIERPLYIHICV